MTIQPTEINSVEEMYEIVDQLILYTLGNSNYPVVQCSFIVSPTLNVKDISESVVKLLKESAVGDERHVESNVGQSGVHIGRNFTVSMRATS